ncbi:MAG TPA: hypothetical protein DEO64_03835 [Alcaligenes faecalis]|nr:hypothetical protein [Alcaligenes faecalis]
MLAFLLPAALVFNKARGATGKLAGLKHQGGKQSTHKAHKSSHRRNHSKHHRCHQRKHPTTQQAQNAHDNTALAQARTGSTKNN